MSARALAPLPCLCAVAALLLPLAPASGQVYLPGTWYDQNKTHDANGAGIHWNYYIDDDQNGEFTRMALPSVSVVDCVRCVDAPVRGGWVGARASWDSAGGCV